MLYVTGDVHADVRDFESRPFGRVKKDDYVLVCGDFGMIWDDSPEEKKLLAKLGKSKHPILFIDGSHENFDLLGHYPVEQWNGGKVQAINDKVLHLMRGQVYTIDGKKIFTFGGGESEDKEMREPGTGWWPQEMPSTDEMREGIENLVANDWQVDYIFTYEAPSSVRRLLVPDTKELNAFHVYLDHVREKCQFVRWIFGNYHCNRRLSTSMDTLYDDVIHLITNSDKVRK